VAALVEDDVEPALQDPADIGQRLLGALKVISTVTQLVGRQTAERFVRVG
jgi:hypothetical protein